MADEQAFLAPASALLAGKPIASPFQFLFTGEDNLRVVLINSLSGVTVTLDGRYLPVGGTPQAFTQGFKPTADRQPATFDFGFGDGYLLNCSVIVTSGSPLVGQTYVMVQIIRGLGGATLVLGCLLGGYVTAMQHVAYPGSPIESSIAGGGYIRGIVGTRPAAGADFQETVPAGARWELLNCFGLLTTAAGGVNRQPRFRLLSAGVNAGLTPGVYSQAPSAGAIWNWAPAAPLVSDATNNNYMLPIPQAPIILASGVFGSLTLNIAAGDQWAAPEYMVREWLEAA